MTDLPKTRVCQRCDKLRPIEQFPLRWGRPCKTCRECIPTYRRKAPWEGTKHQQACRRWKRENPAKHRAHVAVNRALARGELVKPAHCERCERTDIHGHHDNYDDPLAVMWLCPSHHAVRHREIGKPWWEKGAAMGGAARTAKAKAAKGKLGAKPEEQRRAAA